MIDFYYDTSNQILINKLNITDRRKLKIAENYYFKNGFKNLTNDFSVEPDYISHLHYKFFKEVYNWAGSYRLIDVEKSEEALAGLSIKYYSYNDIQDSLNSVLLCIKRIKLSDLSQQEKINYISDLCIKVWHVHPFRDCNTRTLVAYIYQYCKSNSITFEANLLIQNMDYFRRSLVASVF